MSQLLKWLGTISAILLSLLLVISILATNNTWYNRGLNDMVAPLDGVDLLSLISTENHSFKQALPTDYQQRSIGNMLVSSTTSLDLNNPLSLLAQGIPIMSSFDTRIVQAGEGTNLTNMPRESTPPEEALEKLAKEHANSTPTVETPATNNDGQATEPSVLIYHTHSYESYLPELGFEGDPNADKAISSDPTKNIIRVGNRFAEVLGEHDIIADVDQTNVNAYMLERDMKNYYAASRQIVTKQMDEQDYDLILDFHRDSVRAEHTVATINNERFARILFVVGTAHPNADAQRKAAIELNERIEAEYPGLSRGVFEKDKSQGNGVYNQDLADTAMLIEFGGVDNTMDESLRSAEAVAGILADYYKETIRE
ncbi:stage II sporulation protein P [Alkalihalobacillus xiaoxiensis]|uniref:Stage II sporulation protein P n=1 Tax=Shouchella xiaoxiensis TaxID=766895 RepID=A0ABS2T070_9BACI|nr:stage II sporulation protein P [Shouchella xiaoxiensis]MBM7840114.1 stage II sporulation protein P [Shouchella xiaoxiensis]